MKIKKIAIFSLIILTELKIASAYIDPSGGVAILSSAGSIIGAIIALIGAFFIKRLIKPIKNIFLKITRQFKEKDKNTKESKKIKKIKPKKKIKH